MCCFSKLEHTAHYKAKNKIRTNFLEQHTHACTHACTHTHNATHTHTHTHTHTTPHTHTPHTHTHLQGFVAFWGRGRQGAGLCVRCSGGLMYFVLFLFQTFFKRKRFPPQFGFLVEVMVVQNFFFLVVYIVFVCLSFCLCFLFLVFFVAFSWQWWSESAVIFNLVSKCCTDSCS